MCASAYISVVFCEHVFFGFKKIQLLGGLLLVLISALTAVLLLLPMKLTCGIRVSEIEEKVGLDFIYHGNISLHLICALWTNPIFPNALGFFCILAVSLPFFCNFSF